MIGFVALNLVALSAVFASGSEHLFASILLAASFLISLVCYTHAAYARTLSATSATYLLYATYGFILAGLMQVRTDTFFWNNYSVRRDLIPDAAVIVLLGTVFFSVGYLIGLVRYKPGLTNHEYQASPAQRLRISRATFACSLIAMMYLLSSIAAYGPFIFIGTRYTVKLTLGEMGFDLSAIGLTLTLNRGLVLSSFVIAGYVVTHMRVRNPWTKSALAMSACSLMVSNFPPALARFWLIATVTAVLMSVGAGWFRRSKTYLFTLAPMVMFFIFPFLQSYNRRSETLNLNYSFKSPFESMLHGDYDGVQSVINTFSLIEQSGMSYGGRLMSSILFFVPRSLWSGKYEPTGSDAASAAGFDFLNISAPLPAEFLADFHFIGVIVGMFVVGLMIRLLDARFEHIRFPVTGMVAIVLAGFAPIIGRGPLLGVIAAPASAIFLIAVWTVLCKVSFGKTRFSEGSGVSQRYHFRSSRP